MHIQKHTADSADHNGNGHTAASCLESVGVVKDLRAFCVFNFQSLIHLEWFDSKLWNQLSILKASEPRNHFFMESTPRPFFICSDALSLSPVTRAQNTIRKGFSILHLTTLVTQAIYMSFQMCNHAFDVTKSRTSLELCKYKEFSK